MYPYLLCNVDVMISTLQKCLQDALVSLVGPSCSFRIGSHLGRDKLAGVGLAAAPQTSPARVLAGPQQGPCRGLAGVPDKHYKKIHFRDDTCLSQ